MSENQDRIQQYRELVLAYEALDEQIDALLEQNGGHSENMSDADMEHYRELAERRDDLFNQLKAIEAGWQDEG